jgi:hypothetical protein
MTIPLNDVILVCVLVVFWLLLAGSLLEAAARRSLSSLSVGFWGVVAAAWLAVENAGPLALLAGAATCALLLVFAAFFGFSKSPRDAGE